MECGKTFGRTENNGIVIRFVKVDFHSQLLTFVDTWCIIYMLIWIITKYKIGNSKFQYLFLNFEC